jgi:hypothetical protein
VWVVPGRFFQSLPVPVKCFGGEGRESPVRHGAQGSARGEDERGRIEWGGGASTGEGGHEWGRTGRRGLARARRTNGCIMHRVHTSGGGVTRVV